MRLQYAGQPNNVCCDPIVFVDPETHAILTTSVANDSATAPSSAAIVETSTPLAVAAGESAFVQNLSTAPLFVKLGTGASATSFHFILNAGTAEDDGTGGATPKDSPLEGYVGVVSFFSTDFRYVAWVR